MRATVISSMRNEGAFLLEWVTWQRMLGFSDVVVVTNDCSDGSEVLLAALQHAGWLRHIDCDLKAGQPGISTAKYQAAAGLPEVAGADWVMVCDVDEFLVIHAGQGLLSDLLAAPGRDFLGMSVNWKVFGSGGVTDYADLPVHRQFQSCLRPRAGLNAWVKSLFRHPDWFHRLREHGPQGLNLRKAERLSGCRWGEGGLCWVTPGGAPVPGWAPEGPYLQAVKAGEIDHRVAQINHYMLRSAESFSLKRGTSSPTAGKDRYTDDYWARADQAQGRDLSALAYAARFDRLWAEALALPGVARAHDLCCAAHVAAIALKAGRRAEEDPRHAAFLARAAGRPGQP